MKKAAVITLCIALVLSVFAFSEAGETADGFWAKLKQKVQAATPKKEAPTTTAVAGVRGADTDRTRSRHRCRGHPLLEGQG
jgi:hypothetical protein